MVNRLQFIMKPGPCKDSKAFKSFTINLPAKSKIHINTAYNDYKYIGFS